MKNQTAKNKDFTEFRSRLGKRLQDLRKQKGLSQEELAAKIGLDRVSVGYIEQGIRTPKLRTLFTMAAALEVSLEDLFKPFGRQCT